MPLTPIENPGDLLSRFWLAGLGGVRGSAFNEHPGDASEWTTTNWVASVLGRACGGLFYWCEVETDGVHFETWILPLAHCRPALLAAPGTGLGHIWSFKSPTHNSDTPAGLSNPIESKSECPPMVSLSLKAYFRDTGSKPAVRKTTAH